MAKFPSVREQQTAWAHALEVAGLDSETCSRPPQSSGVSEMLMRRVVSHILERLETLEGELAVLRAQSKIDKAK